MAELSQLEQVKLDAERITRERIEAEVKAKAWQEAQSHPVSLDESVEAAIEDVETENEVVETEPEVETPKKVVKKRKDQ